MTSSEWLDIFADNLRDLMIEHDMTQNDLARISGVNRSAINKYLQKRQFPTFQSIMCLCYAFNMDLAEFADFGEPIERD